PQPWHEGNIEQEYPGQPHEDDCPDPTEALGGHATCPEPVPQKPAIHEPRNGLKADVAAFASKIDRVPQEIRDLSGVPGLVAKPDPVTEANQRANAELKGSITGDGLKFFTASLIKDECSHGAKVGAPCNTCPGSYARRAM